MAGRTVAAGATEARGAGTGALSVETPGVWRVVCELGALKEEALRAGRRVPVERLERAAVAWPWPVPPPEEKAVAGGAGGVGGRRAAASGHDVAAADHVAVEGDAKRTAATPPQADGLGAASAKGVVATPRPAVAARAAAPTAVEGAPPPPTRRRRVVSHAGEAVCRLAHHDKGDGAPGDVRRERAVGVSKPAHSNALLLTKRLEVRGRVAVVAPRPSAAGVPTDAPVGFAAAPREPPLVEAAGALVLLPLRPLEVAAAGAGHGVHPTLPSAVPVVEVVAPDAPFGGQTLEEGTPGAVDGELAQTTPAWPGPVVGGPCRRAPRHVCRLVVDGAAVHAGVAAHEVAEVGRGPAVDPAAAGVVRHAARLVAAAAVVVALVAVPGLGPGQGAPPRAAHVAVAEPVAVGVPPDAARGEDAPLPVPVGAAAQASGRLLAPRSAGELPTDVLPPGPDVPAPARRYEEVGSAHDLLLGVAVDLAPVVEAVDAGEGGATVAETVGRPKPVAS